MNGRNDIARAYAKQCLLRRPWPRPSDRAIPAYWDNLNRKFYVPIKAGHGSSNSTDLNWLRLLPPTGPSQLGVSYIERRSVLNPGSHYRESSALPTELRDGHLQIGSKVTFARHPTNRCLTAYQIWAQWAQPFSRSGSAPCTCARAVAPHPWHTDTYYLMGACLHTKFQSNRPSHCGEIASGTFLTPLAQYVPRAVVTTQM